MTEHIVIRSHPTVSRIVTDSLREIVATRETLAHVLAWCAAGDPPRIPIASIAQDEFSHDVVVPFDESVFLSFEVT